jgi:uncharacterized protein (UPF0335 family)
MDNISGISGNQLRLFIEKIEKLESEKADLMENIKEVFAESKSSGFDPKIMKEIIKIRKMKNEDRIEQEELLDIYKAAIGMV